MAGSPRFRVKRHTCHHRPVNVMRCPVVCCKTVSYWHNNLADGHCKRPMKEERLRGADRSSLCGRLIGKESRPSPRLDGAPGYLYAVAISKYGKMLSKPAAKARIPRRPICRSARFVLSLFSKGRQDKIVTDQLRM